MMTIIHSHINQMHSDAIRWIDLNWVDLRVVASRRITTECTSMYRQASRNCQKVWSRPAWSSAGRCRRVAAQNTVSSTSWPRVANSRSATSSMLKMMYTCSGTDLDIFEQRADFENSCFFWGELSGGPPGHGGYRKKNPQGCPLHIARCETLGPKSRQKVDRKVDFSRAAALKKIFQALNATRTILWGFEKTSQKISQKRGGGSERPPPLNRLCTCSYIPTYYSGHANGNGRWNDRYRNNWRHKNDEG